MAGAPARAWEPLDHLMPGPRLLRSHCFAGRSGYEGPSATYLFRDGGSGDQGTDWLAAHGLLLPVGPDLAELPYEVARALREQEGTARPCLEPEPLTTTAPLPAGWDGEGVSAAGAAA